MRIVMLEPIAVSEALLTQLTEPFVKSGHEVELCLKPMSEDEKLQKAKTANIIVVANSPLSGSLVESSPNLKMISVAFTGVDHIPKDICIQRNILVSNSQGYATVAVTELTFGLIFSCLRNLLPCDGATRNGLTKDGLVGCELYGKTLGIVGYGAIGSSVARIAKAFGCKVLAYSSHPGNDEAVVFCSLEELLKQSNIVSLHVPLTEQTKKLIDKDKLSLMKPSAYLINTARGGVVDTAALAEALNEGTIAGAGLDVFDAEPPIAKADPLMSAKNAVLAPHVGFATKESMVKRAEIVFKNISAWLEGNPINVKI